MVIEPPREGFGCMRYDAAPTCAGVRAALADITARHDATPGQVALARVQHRPQTWGLTVVPLRCTNSVSHLRDNIAAADLFLSTADLALLDALSPGTVGGPAYPLSGE